MGMSSLLRPKPADSALLDLSGRLGYERRTRPIQGCDQPDWGELTVADAWLPTAARMPAKDDGGFLRGGAPRAVWFTSETDPWLVSARSVAQDLSSSGQAAHLAWNPLNGDLVQMVPATRAACMLPPDIGVEGRICLQLMVVGYAAEAFTAGQLKGLAAIMTWLDTWGVARRWPAGPPLPSPQSFIGPRNRRAWARGGHFGCSQVPEATGPGPGGIDIRKITGPETPVADLPRPRPVRPRAIPQQQPVPVDGNGSHPRRTTRLEPVPAAGTPHSPIPEPGPARPAGART
jgi:hypothetical protein